MVVPNKPIKVPWQNSFKKIVSPISRFIAFCMAAIFIVQPASTARAISIPDEIKLGQEFMTMIRGSGLILHDPVTSHMINTVGNHILTTLPPQPFNFSFYLINDGSFNAFASPAANIFVHRGLITSLENMDEFAGIMAHEIAHAVSRHVSQSIDRSKLVSLGSLAGILAGVLIGTAGGNGDAASALTLGSAAAAQSSMLAFTRDNETEADQKAVIFLEETGYCPIGLISGLNKIREADYRGTEGIPDYFKTHPGTSNRIAHLAGILADYTPPAGKTPPPETYDFNMVKYRVIGLYGKLGTQAQKVKTSLDKDPDNPALNYGMGLLYSRQNRRDLAIEHLQKSLSVKVYDPMILLELGRVYILDGKFEKALNVLTPMERDPVLGLWASYYAAVAQLETGNLNSSKQRLKKVLSLKPQAFPRAYYHLANIMSQKGNAPVSHYYLGIYYSKSRHLTNAIRHLTRAVETLEDPKMKKDAQKRLNNLNELAKKLKRS